MMEYLLEMGIECFQLLFELLTTISLPLHLWAHLHDGALDLIQGCEQFLVPLLQRLHLVLQCAIRFLHHGQGIIGL